MTRGIEGRRLGRGTVAITATFVVVTALLISVFPAQAGEKYYEGEVTGLGGYIEMVVVRDHGKVTVEHFHADDLDCPGWTGDANFGIREIKVNDKGRFNDTKSFGGHGRNHLFAIVRGRLLPGGRARGTLLYHGYFDGIGICDTGTRGWKARR
jgi:hypothetical protein